MIVYHCPDLLSATRIKSTADALGIPCRPVRTLEMLRARLADCAVRGLIVDLECGQTAIECIAALRGVDVADAHRAIRIVAYGPHVETEALRIAAATGADAILTRGAFVSRLPDILNSLSGEQPRSDK
ncbi:MAG: hypothetical protein JNM07_00255 [Phycisphaerae bacterium]|nr:hypothetical protein [Phycisphaerae bacterium]